MEGKRLKRRLLWIACLSYPLALVTMGLTFAALVLLLARVRIAARGNIWEGPLCIGVCAGVGCLTLFLLKVLYVRLGWMTREESRPFPFQMQKDRWPDSWLEPTDRQENPDEDRDQGGGSK